MPAATIRIDGNFACDVGLKKPRDSGGLGLIVDGEWRDLAMVDGVVGRGVRQVAVDPAAIALALLARLLAERERWILWLPVTFALGIGSYFALRSEPWSGLGLVLAMPLAGISLWARRSIHPLAPGVLLIAVPFCLMASGFAAAQWETRRAAAPMLERRLGPVTVEGRVVDVEPLAEGVRVTLAAGHIDRLTPDHLPAQVRVRLKTNDAVPAVGDRLQLSAILMPPPAPALPGGFDFQRQAFYRRLGAVGFAVGPSTLTPASHGGLVTMLRAIRSGMTARIHAALPGPEGATPPRSSPASAAPSQNLSIRISATPDLRICW